MPGTFTQLLVHTVFATKGREPWLSPALIVRLYPYIGAIVKDRKGSLLEIGGIADHVHLLVRSHPQESISELMRFVKAGSSKWIHDTFPDLRAFAWQEGYAAFAVSKSQEHIVRTYIQNQESHHERCGFNDELRRLLVAHDVEFDERYAQV